jgi:uncharacterized FlaG/YvyC family protein
MKYLTIIIALFLTIGSISQAFEEESSKNPSIQTDFIYVVALEKGMPDETSDKWNPTLYQIDVERKKVIQTVKLAEQGAPVYCERFGDKEIRVYTEEGIAANGTFVWKPTTRTVHIDKTSLKITKDEITQGISTDKWMKNIERNTPDLKNIKSIGTYLGEFIDSKLFVLTYRDDKHDRAIKILDADSNQEIGSIPMTDKERQLGGFTGRINRVWHKDRLLICLFDGENRLGYFTPGYVVIIDIIARQAEYIAIGSNPAMGIAY